MKNRLASAVVIIIVLVVIIAFFVYANPNIASSLGLSHSNSPQPVASSTMHRVDESGNFIAGSIESLNDNGFTIVSADGSTKNVTLTATTTIEMSTSASSTPATTTPDQLSVGEQVRIVGTTENDGSISARRVIAGTR